MAVEVKNSATLERLPESSTPDAMSSIDWGFVAGAPSVSTPKGPDTPALSREEGITEVSLLKVDVEGFETEVFRGAADNLSCGAIQRVLFEYSPEFYRRRLEGSVGRETAYGLAGHSMMTCV